MNVDSLNDDLAKSAPCKNPPDDLEELLLSYTKTLIAVLDKHSPVKTGTLLSVRKFHGTQTKSDKPRENDGKLKEDGDCRNLIPTWLSSKLSAMLSTIL